MTLEIEEFHTWDDKFSRLLPILKTRTGPTIIYVTLKKQTELLAEALCAQGVDALWYHAGLNSEERERIQEQFMQSDNAIVCATIAFGMGIDKGEWHILPLESIALTHLRITQLTSDW